MCLAHGHDTVTRPTQRLEEPATLRSPVKYSTNYNYSTNYKLFMSIFSKGNFVTEQFFFFFKFSPGNLLIFLYLLTKFEAPSCYTFLDILKKIIMILEKGHNSTKGDNLDKNQQKYGSAIF